MSDVAMVALAVDRGREKICVTRWQRCTIGFRCPWISPSASKVSAGNVSLIWSPICPRDSSMTNSTSLSLTPAANCVAGRVAGPFSPTYARFVRLPRVCARFPALILSPSLPPTGHSGGRGKSNQVGCKVRVLTAALVQQHLRSSQAIAGP